MSGVFLKMPRLGETMEEGVIIGWLVEVGTPFSRGDPLIEVDTDKTAVEFPALGAGTLLERLVEEGDLVQVGARIARIDVGDGPDWTADGEDGESDDPAPSARSAPTEAEDGGAADAADAGVEIDPLAPDRPAAPEVVPEAAPLPVGHSSEGPVRATPVARRLARANGVELGTLRGSGRRGRVEAADVERALGEGAGGAAASDTPVDLPTAGDCRHAHDIAYVASGPEEGTPFLLVHGFAADRTAFAVLAHGLARAGHRVVALDLPAHGATRLEAADAGDLVRNLEPFCDTLFGERAPHVVAHSLGAVAATALAGSRPLASLSLIAPVGLGLGIDASFVAGLARPTSAGEVAHLLRRLTARPQPMSEAAIEAIFRTLARGRLERLADTLCGRAGQTIDLVPTIERLARETSVRVLIGHRDGIVDPGAVDALSPLVAVHHFVQSGHMPHWEQPREALDILTRGSRA